jgi:hypothetical protein
VNKHPSVACTDVVYYELNNPKLTRDKSLECTESPKLNPAHFTNMKIPPASEYRSEILNQWSLEPNTDEGSMPSMFWGQTDHTMEIQFNSIYRLIYQRSFEIFRVSKNNGREWTLNQALITVPLRNLWMSLWISIETVVINSRSFPDAYPVTIIRDNDVNSLSKNLDQVVVFNCNDLIKQWILRDNGSISLNNGGLALS